MALLDIVSENLKQPHENVQNAAARALRQLLHFYFAAPIGSPAFQKLQKMTVLKYVAGLRAAENVAWTRGYSLALGVLPFHITSEPPEVFDQVLDVLSIVIDPEHKIAGEPDADTRRNAVYAVSELGERLSLAIFKQGGLKSDEIDLPWLQRAEFCVKILLKACNDYSVDKRGDTGSWSRIGAMLGLERLVYAFMRASPTYPADKKVALFTYRCSTFCSGKNIEGPVKAVPVISIGTHVWTSFGHGIITELDESLGTARIHFPKQSLGHNEFISSEGICSMRIRKLEVIGLSENSGDLDNHDFLPTIEERSTILPVLKAVRTIEEMITSVSVEMFVCILLKQLGEKLDAVRGIAGGILARILASADPVVFCVRDRKILTTAIASRQTIQSPELNWKLSSVVFPFLGEVLKSETYFHWIISGFVISVGGLTEAIVKDSSKTLLTWCRDKRKDGDVRSISWLARSIHKLFEDYERNDRVILPLLKSLQLLLQNAIFDNVFPDSAFKDKLFAYLKNELNKCSDTRKIRSCIDIYMHLVNSPDPLRQNCIKTMLIMLGHQFPQVRKYVAEQLYLLFIGDPFVVGPRILPTLTDFPTADDNENSAVLDKTIPRRSGLVTSAELATKVMMYLADTVWDRQILVARDIRGLIAEAMGVSLNIKVRATDNGRLGGCKVVSDELDSYEALVRDAGY